MGKKAIVKTVKGVGGLDYPEVHGVPMVIDTQYGESISAGEGNKQYKACGGALFCGEAAVRVLVSSRSWVRAARRTGFCKSEHTSVRHAAVECPRGDAHTGIAVRSAKATVPGS